MGRAVYELVEHMLLIFANFFFEQLLIFFPLKNILPDICSFKNPSILFKSVVFPTPLGPSMQNISPSFICNTH